MDSLRILHIANYYIDAKIHRDLASVLDKAGLEQTIYTAFIGQHLIGANSIGFEVPGSKIIYRPILNTSSRLNYNHKIKKITRDIVTQATVGNYDLIHAHTLFSDGKVAYNLFKKYGTPYIVAIRNTDLNLFFKYFLHLRPQAKRTLLSTKKIIFITESYRKRLLAHPYFADCNHILREKSIVLPNGIDDYWLTEAVNISHQTHHNPAQLLYVGKISRSKNLLKLIKVVNALNQKDTPCVLNIVGKGSGSYYQKVEQAIKKHPGFLIYHGAIKEKAKLLSLYRASDLFVMPSRNETFGLVYLEALSQGTPVIYTRGEGIDGLFPPETGEAVNCRNRHDIEAKIQKVLLNYSDFRFEPKKVIHTFNWKNIAKEYQRIYESILTDNISDLTQKTISSDNLSR